MERLSYYIKIKKSIYYKDKLPVEINIDTSQLGNIIIESIILKIKNIFFYMIIMEIIMEKN